MKKILLLLLSGIAILFLSILILLTNHSSLKSRPTARDSVSPSPLSPTHSNDTPLSLKTPTGFTIRVFAKGLGMPRDLELTDKGTILASDPFANTVVALTDTDGNGTAEVHKVLTGNDGVHGLAFHDGELYVASRIAVNRYHYDEDTFKATFDKKIVDLPYGSLHNFRSLIFGHDNKLYISVGAGCNVCVETDDLFGTVLQTDENGRNLRVFSKGLRNAPFLTLSPKNDNIWVTEMGRDYLGDDLPPDEINILKNGGDYGWPICYGNKVHDTDFDHKQYIQDPCINTISPVFEIPAHSAPLGLTFIPENFNPDWAGDLLVAYHGSWNRTVKTGYKVVKMTVSGNKITGTQTIIDGFLQNNNVQARPVDLLFDKKGNLYISDDKAGYVFVMSKK